jgi:hypothetical protein
VIFLQFSFLVVQSTNKFPGGIYSIISVTVWKDGQISKVFWVQHTQELWFHTGSITNTKDGRFHAFPYIRSVASSILFYITFYQLHMPSQDVIPHHPCSGSANEPYFKVLKDSPENFRDLSILSDCDTGYTIDAVRKLVCRLYDWKTVRLPIPNKDDVESHPVMACASGKMLYKTGLRMLQIACTGMHENAHSWCLC